MQEIRIRVRTSEAEALTALKEATGERTLSKAIKYAALNYGKMRELVEIIKSENDNLAKATEFLNLKFSKETP